MGQIYIANKDGQKLSIEVDNLQCQAIDILQIYAVQIGILPQNIKLSFNNQKWGDNELLMSLNDLGVGYQDTINAQLINTQENQFAQLVQQLKQHMQQQQNNTITIKVQTIDKQKHMGNCPKDTTIYQIKQNIYKYLSKSLQVKLMGIFYKETELQNNAKLSQCNFQQQIPTLRQDKCSLTFISKLKISNTEDPTGLDKITAIMPCGHIIGKQGMIILIKNVVAQKNYVIKCPHVTESKKCNSQWDFGIVRKIGIFTKQQCDHFQEQLTKNWVLSNASDCPKCGNKVYKGDLKKNRVKCPHCKYGDYCFVCSKKWVNDGTLICGNKQCTDINKLLAESQWDKQFMLKPKDKQNKQKYMLPSIRACPKCHVLINHKNGCKHMTCPCKIQFCFVCLAIQQNGKWPCGGYSEYCGNIAPAQVIK